MEAGVDPGFEVLTEASAERLFDRAFREWFQRGSSRLRGVRRALRRLPPPWSPYARREDGPVARLRKAAIDLREWRDLRAPWRATRSIATGEMKRRVDEALRVRGSHREGVVERRSLLQTTEQFRTLAADFRRAQADGSSVDLNGRGGAACSCLQVVPRYPDREATALRGRRHTSGGHRGERRIGAVTAHVRPPRRRRPRRAAAAGVAPLRGLDDDLKTRAGLRPDFLDLLLRARDLVRDAPRPPRVRGAVRIHPRRRVPGHPIRGKRRSCCCSPRMRALGRRHQALARSLGRMAQPINRTP